MIRPLGLAFPHDPDVHEAATVQFLMLAPAPA